jgi:hypothetical protein
MWRARGVKPKERDYLDDLGECGRIILNWILKNVEWSWAELIWLREGTRGGLLWIR